MTTRHHLRNLLASLRRSHRQALKAERIADPSKAALILSTRLRVMEALRETERMLADLDSVSHAP